MRLFKALLSFLAMAFASVMLLVDLAYAFIDPRIKDQFSGKKKKKHSGKSGKEKGRKYNHGHA